MVRSPITIDMPSFADGFHLNSPRSTPSSSPSSRSDFAVRGRTRPPVHVRPILECAEGSVVVFMSSYCHRLPVGSIVLVRGGCQGSMVRGMYGAYMRSKGNRVHRMGISAWDYGQNS